MKYSAEVTAPMRSGPATLPFMSVRVTLSASSRVITAIVAA